MTTVATLVAKLEADIRDFDRKLKKAEERLDEVEKATRRTNDQSGKLSEKWGALATKAAVVAGATAAVGAVAYSAVKSFSDLEESTNAVNVVFGDAAQQIVDFGDSAATNVGLAQSEFQQLASVTGSLLQNFGVSLEKASDLTLDLTNTAADLASVYNTDVDDALSAINAGLRGEAEQLRRYAIDVSEITLQQFALANGIEKSVAEMSQQEKIQLRLQAIFAQSAKTAGDFANTSDSVANRMKILGARFEDAKATVGEALLPAMEGLLTVLEKGIPLLEAFAKALGFVVNLSFGKIDQLKDDYAEINALIADGVPEAEAAAQVLSSHLADAMGNAADKAWLLTGAEAETRMETARAKEEAANAADSWNEGAIASAALAAAQADAKRKIAPTTDEIRAQRDAIIALARAQGAAADPVLGLLQANADYEKALADLNKMQEEGNATGAEMEAAQRRVVDTYGDIIGAKAEVVTALGDNIDAFREMALQAGLSADAVDRLIERIFAIPTGTVGPRFTSPQMGGFGPGEVPMFQSGGVVPGPVGAPVEAIVHGGEAIIPPSLQGLLGGGGTGEINIGTMEVTLHGTFDQSDPASARRFAVQMREELDRLNTEVA